MMDFFKNIVAKFFSNSVEDFKDFSSHHVWFVQFMLVLLFALAISYMLRFFHKKISNKILGVALLAF